MSLFTDLRDVLTPYAQRINALKADLNPLYNDKNNPFIFFAIGSFDGAGNVENSKRVRTNKQLFRNCDLVEFTWDSTLEVRIGAWHVESVGGVDTDVWDDWQNNWGDVSFIATGGRKYRALVRYKNDTSHTMTDEDVTFITNHIFVTAKIASHKAPDAELGAKIEKVKEEFANNLIALSDIYNYTSDGGFSVYEIGSFDGTSDITNNSRIRTNYQFIDTDVVRITFDSSLEVRVGCFTNGTPKVYEGMANNWGETVIVVKGGKNIRAVIRYKDDTDHVMTDEDVTFVESHVYVEAGTNEYNVNEEETVYDSGIKRKVPTWRIGTISSSTGQNGDSTTRIRSSVFIKLDQTNDSISLVSTDQSLSARVIVYGEDNNNSFEKCMSGWAQESPKLPTDKYLRIVIRYNDNRTLNDSMIDAMLSAFRFSVSSDIHESRYDLFEGKTVAIFGDSISTTGYNYIDEESQVPELIIMDEDVDEEAELKVWLTYRDFHPYAGNGVPPEDTTEENPCNGTNVHDLILGGVTYHYEFTAIADGGDDIPYVTYTIGGVAHKDVLGAQEYTFVPTAADVGKHFGQADNHNQGDALPNWWQLAQKELHFIPLNACFSGSCVSRARNSGDDEGPRQQQHGSHSWNLGQIRRCGRRIPGTMNRESPDVIIIYRGTNDYGSPQNGQHPRVGTDILETNQNLQTYFEQNKDLVGIVRSNGTIVPIGSASQAGDRDLYGFTEAYLLTIMRLQKAYPFAKIFCCTLDAIKRTTTTNSNYPLRNSSGTLAQWNNAIRKVAEFTGCGVIDFGSGGFSFFNCQIYYPEAPTTGVHPYRDGQAVMGNRAIADLKAQYGEMLNEWKSIKELLNDTSVVACSDDTGFPTSDPRGAYQYVRGKMKAHCIWDGVTTIG